MVVSEYFIAPLIRRIAKLFPFWGLHTVCSLSVFWSVASRYNMTGPVSIVLRYSDTIEDVSSARDQGEVYEV
jgi:hypothetical protein